MIPTNQCNERKERRMKKIISLLLALALCCMMIPAMAENASLVGTWYIAHAEQNGSELKVVDSSAMTLEIREDGTFTMSAMGSGTDGTWTATDSAITLTANEEPIEFKIKGEEIIYDTGTAVVYLSQTPAAAADLPIAVGAASIDEFNGTWVPTGLVMTGLYMQLDEASAAAYPKMKVENGKVTMLMDDGNGQLTESGVYEMKFDEDGGRLEGEDNTFIQTFMTLTLQDDGSLYYASSADLGGTKLETAFYYAREAE